MKIVRFLATLAAVAACGQTAQAALVDRGGGMVYDTDLDVTWLRSWNQAAGSVFEEPGLPGYMTWQNAMLWADSLSVAGYTDWRLPSASQGGIPCTGANCIDSEMGHIFYTELGNAAGALTNVGPFTDMGRDRYWTSTQAPFGAPPPDVAVFFFNLATGEQGVDTSNHLFRAVAVRSGDVPAPQTLSLVLLGLAAGALAQRRR